MNVKRLFVCVVLAASISGCANFQKTWDTLTGARISPTAVSIAANTADSGEIIATAYLRACHKSPGKFAACAKPIEAQVVDALNDVISGRKSLRAFLVAHPDALGAGGLYDALSAAQSTLTKIINDYSLSKVSA